LDQKLTVSNTAVQTGRTVLLQLTSRAVCLSVCPSVCPSDYSTTCGKTAVLPTTTWCKRKSKVYRAFAQNKFVGFVHL